MPRNIRVEIELLGLQVPECWQLPGAGVENKSLCRAPQRQSGPAAFYYDIPRMIKYVSKILIHKSHSHLL